MFVHIDSNSDFIDTSVLLNFCNHACITASACGKFGNEDIYYALTTDKHVTAVPIYTYMYTA